MSAVPEYQPPDPSDTETAAAFLAGDTSNLAAAITDLETDVPHYIDHHDPADVVRLLAELRERRQQLATIEAYVETAVGRAFGKGEHKVAGFQVKVHSDGRWTDWRHDDVAFRVCRDLAVDPDSGEVIPEVVQIVDAVRSRLLNCARPSWRLTQLRTHGVDPADFATWQRGRHSVTLTKDVTA